MQNLAAEPLVVACAQTDIAWECPRENLPRIERFIARAARQGVHLLIFPEVPLTGFTMHLPAMAQAEPYPHALRVKEWAEQYNVAVGLTLLVRQGDRVFNRAFFFTPQGETFTQDKRHLFRMAGERDKVSPARQMNTFTYRGWRIRPIVCYDLRFPVWSRNTPPYYDLLLVLSNWPRARAAAWNILLQARAVENLCYVCGVNRVGTDPQGVVYQGDSRIISFKGEVMAQATPMQEELVSATLDASALKTFRERFPAHLDADAFTLSL